jgi:hypothetical protein
MMEKYIISKFLNEFIFMKEKYICFVNEAWVLQLLAAPRRKRRRDFHICARIWGILVFGQS